MKHNGKALITALLLMSTACVAPRQAAGPGSAGQQPSCAAEAGFLQKGPGREWWDENRWRFQSDEAAAAAYNLLAEQASPWPDWYVPYESALPPGTRFQMAIGGIQTPEMPDNFGTFDQIRSVDDVRANLAVRQDWKPLVDRVVTYEVIRSLPVKIGPIGPQVDPARCVLLHGRWSQFEALVERGTLIAYVKVIGVRPID